MAVLSSEGRILMLMSHRIRLNPSILQREYFVRACGAARRVWNWAVAEWRRQVAEGLEPHALALKKQFNAIKYSDPAWLDELGQPWLRAIHRDAHSQPFANLNKASVRYFAQRRAGKPAHEPKFKKKGNSRDSFYIANDRFHLEVNSIVLPKIGKISLQEGLRFPGKIKGASVSREADHWFISVLVDVPEHVFQLHRDSDGIVGVDLGISAAATLSTGEKLMAPRPLHAALRRLRIRSRRQARKMTAAKKAAGIHGQIQKGIRLVVSKKRVCDARNLARLHARIAYVRKDFIHKLTNRLCRENQAVIIEDLNVQGMMSNDSLSLAIADVGFYEIRRQLEYKSTRYGTTLVVADRWYPSSKLCSGCGERNASLTLGDRAWTCLTCHAHHDRDVNAAINLERLATGVLAAQPALPVASSTVTSDTLVGTKPTGGGKVTPVRDERGQQDGSGQE